MSLHARLTTLPPLCCCFDEDYGGRDLDEGFFHPVLGQGRRGAGMLAMAITGVKVVAVCVTMEGDRGRGGGEGSTVNKIAEKEKQ